ncbi:MAG: 4Fe-4S binding protein [Ruminococcus sp.]|nr:4Fe-4S binding protein [Ruminococcus sp.]
MLFLAPAIFSIGLNGLKSLIVGLAEGSYSGLSSFIMVALLLLIATFIFGRFFCGWLCLFGAYSELIYFIFGRFTKRLKPKLQPTEKYLRYFKYLTLAFVVILCIVGYQSVLTGTDVWDSFAMVVSGNFKNLSRVYISVIALVIVTIFSAFFERFYCRFICPLGALFSIVDRLKLFTIYKPNDKCGKCPICTNNCPMGIDLNKTSEVCSGECIKCMKCTDVCPRKNTSLSVMYKRLPKWVAIIISIVILIAYFVIT